jgi:hypothetical protein
MQKKPKKTWFEKKYVLFLILNYFYQVRQSRTGLGATNLCFFRFSGQSEQIVPFFGNGILFRQSIFGQIFD